jgi:hypothetical protein
MRRASSLAIFLGISPGIVQASPLAAAGDGGWVVSEAHGKLQYNNQGSCFAVTAHWEAVYSSDFQTFPAHLNDEYNVGAGFFAFLDEGYYRVVPGGGWSEKTVHPGFVVPNGTC